MVDVARLAQVRPATPHLPVSWYFDPKVFELEKMTEAAGREADGGG